MSFELIQNFIVTKFYPALVVVFFFSLTLFAHEYGHFLMARRRGLKVERFSFFGLGPPIFCWTRDGVEYCICWIPFGAYVSIPQMAEMEGLEGKTETDVSSLPPASPMSKILVALLGPLMNVALGLALASVLWVVGKPMNAPVVGWVETGSAEELAGIKPGDRIVAVNEKPVKTWGQLMEAVAFSLESTVNVTVLRDGEEHKYLLETKVNEQLKVKMLEVFPRDHPYVQKVLPSSPAERAGMKVDDQFVSVEGVPVYSSEQLRALIGKRANETTTVKVLRGKQTIALTVTPETHPEEKVGRMGVQLGDRLQIVKPGPTPLEQFSEITGSMFALVKALFHSKETGVKASSMSGPVGILSIWWYGIVSGGIRQGLSIAVMLNLNLALINLLPIPVLDGGHIIFSMIERIRRKPLNARLMQSMTMAFAALLIGFMLYITFFDIQRLIPWRSKTVVHPVSSGTVTNQP